MRRRTVILIGILVLLVGMMGWLTWRHTHGEESIVFVIDSGFTPQMRPEMRARAPAAFPGHGQLTRDIISRRASRNVEIRSLELRGEGEARRQNFLQHLEYIADYASIHNHKNILVNISLAFENYSSREQLILDRLAQQDVLVVAAAGNSGDESNFYPASYREVFTVSGADSQGRLTYATYGENIDLAAPGHISRFLPANFGSFALTRYEMQGTSFAAPRVTGELARLAALVEEEYSLAELAEFSRETAGKIDDELFEQGKLGAGLFQPRKIESLLVPEIYWRRWLFYTFLAALLPAIYMLTGDIKSIWRLRKIKAAAGEAELVELLEDSRQQLWPKIKQEVEENPGLSRERFSKNLLFSEVDLTNKRDYIEQLSGQEVYSFAVTRLADKGTDPEKLAALLSKNSRRKAADLCYSVDRDQLLQSGDKARELRFFLALMQNINFTGDLIELAVAILKQADDPWLIYYALRALQRAETPEYYSLIAAGLEIIENKAHPLYKREIDILRKRLTESN